MSAAAPGEDIAAYQADWNLPPGVLAGVVRRATGAGLASQERILDGHSCEVHGVLTEDGRALIVRVAWRPGPIFEREAWPIAAARRVGLPTPEVLLTEHTNLEGQAVSFNVQQRLPGLLIHRLRRRLSDADLETLTRQAGGYLAALHAISIPGPGPIGPTGRLDPSLATDRDDIIEGLAERSGYLIERGIDRVLVEGAAGVVMDHVELLRGAPVRLIHGDWSLANLLSDGRSITGVVDWEGARGGDPTCDLTSWDQWHDSGPTATRILLEAYEEAGGVLDDCFPQRRLVRRIADLHHAAVHFIATERPDLLAPVLSNLESKLQEAR